MRPAFDSLAAGFPQLIFYLVMVGIIYIGSILTYVRLTPHKELELVDGGNVAASIHFSSLVISMALPVASCLVNKSSLFDVGLWTVFALIFQLFLFRVTDSIIFRAACPSGLNKMKLRLQSFWPLSNSLELSSFHLPSRVNPCPSGQADFRQKKHSELCLIGLSIAGCYLSSSS